MQELREKYDQLPKDIEWHFIGHLQTNKVKYIAPYITMIHAVDSLRLMQEIEKHAEKHNRIIDVLLEIHVAKEESKYGFKLDQCRTFLEDGLWRNMQHTYGQTAMGWNDGGRSTDFNPLYSGTAGMPFGSLVSYMESHDEERTCYEGQWAYDGVSIDFATRMGRAGLNAAFFLMSPGPKMIWQFGELGYDISIEEGGRTGRKTPKWEYLDVPERKALYDTYCDLIKFRRDNPEFFDQTASFSWKVGQNDWDNGRFITCTAGSKSFVVVGNFTVQEKTFTVEMPSDGTWVNQFDKSEVYTGGSLNITLPAGDFRLFTNY